MIKKLLCFIGIHGPSCETGWFGPRFCSWCEIEKWIGYESACSCAVRNLDYDGKYFKLERKGRIMAENFKRMFELKQEDYIDACKEIDVKDAEIAALKSQLEVKRKALAAIMCEIGVPQPGYPQPVANAYEIARLALLGKDWFPLGVLGEEGRGK